MGAVRMVRTFVALEPPPDIQKAMDVLCERLRSTHADVRWESAEKFHSTIKFLGDVEESRLPPMYALFDDIAKACHPFEVVFEKLGAFPDRKRPRVIWVGCTNRDGSLESFKNRLDDALSPLGFEKEDRPFRPHVTLGRVKSHRGNADLLSLMESLTFEPSLASINRIVVLKSVLNPLGAEYSLLHSIQFPS